MRRHLVTIKETYKIVRVKKKKRLDIKNRNKIRHEQNKFPKLKMIKKNYRCVYMQPRRGRVCVFVGQGEVCNGGNFLQSEA